jgi:hypothetical protein
MMCLSTIRTFPFVYPICPIHLKHNIHMGFFGFNTAIIAALFMDGFGRLLGKRLGHRATKGL